MSRPNDPAAPQAPRTTPSLLRAPIARGLAEPADGPAIDPEGGKFSAGLIRGFAVITRGEALGHCLWIDNVFLQQVADALNSQTRGSKSRFTHPGLCSDGMGKYLGRAFDASVHGDVVRADLHLCQSSHNAPDGDLAAYVLQLATEDPAAFGTSIVFEHDDEAEQEFVNANLQEVEETDYKGRPVKRMRFRSPDEQNVNNYLHARLADLRAVDVVDDPAANPTGMFRRGDELASEAEAYLSYALGLSQQKPALSAFSAIDIEPERVQAFLSSFLERHQLQLSGKEVPVTNPAISAPAQPAASAAAEGPSAPTREQFAAELKKFTAAFGAKGAEWFSEGKDYTEALQLHCGELQTQLATAREEITRLEGVVSELRGAKTPVSFGESDSRPDDKPRTGGKSNLPDGLAAFAAANPVPAQKSGQKTAT